MSLNLSLDELRRQEKLKELRILDTGPESEFDDLVHLASQLAGTPIATVTLIDQERQWFKSCLGLPIRETGRAIAFCDYTIRDGQPLVVSNALEDPRFADNPLVTEGPKLRFYTGIPLITGDGVAIGALTVMDTVPRTISPAQIENLEIVARQVVSQLEMRQLLRVQEETLTVPQELPDDLEILRASEMRFRHLFSSAAAGIAIAHMDGRYIQANAAYCQTVGVDEGEIARWNFLELTHPEDRERCAGLVQQLMAKERNSFVIEKRYQRPDGETIWVWTSVSAVPLNESGALYLIAVTMDITQHKLMEQRLHESESLLRIAGQVARIGGWAVDLPHGPLTWSDEVCALHDLPPGTVISVDQAVDFYLPEWRGVIEEAFGKCVQQGIPYKLDAEIMTAKGRRRWVTSTGEVERNEAGEAVRVHGAFQDIDEIKQNEIRLRELADRMTNTLESITDAFVTLDHEWRFTYVNGEAERLMGIPRADLLGRPFWGIYPPYPGMVSYREFQRAVRENITTSFETRQRKTRKWLDVRAFPSKDGLSVYFRNITELRATHEALQESEARFRQMAETIDDVFWTWDPYADRILYVSPRYEQLFEQTREQLYADPRSFLRDIHPEDVELFFEKVSQDPISVEMDFRLNTPSGAFHWVNLKSYPALDAEGKVQYAVGIARDVTELANAADRLRTSETQYRLMFQSNPQPMWVYDVETLDFLAVNEAAVSNYGYSEDEFLTMTLRDLRRAEDLPHLDANLVGFTTGHKFGTWRHVKRDGNVISVETSSDALMFDGKQARIVLVNDVTERKRAEAQIIEQADLLDKARDAIIVCDLEHRITFWNFSAERLYGWREDEVLGRVVDELIYSDADSLRVAHAKVMSTGEWVTEFATTARDGREILIESRWTLVLDDAGQPRSILSINTDISDRKKLESQFLRAQRMESIGTMAGGIAHDLNNVLAPILMSIGMLKQQERPPREMKLLGILESSAQRGADMIRQLLTFARGVDGQRTVIHVDELIGDLEHLIRDTFDRNIALRVDLAKATWPILGDPTQFHQLLLNLCVNARDAMPDGGSLKLSATNMLLDAQYASMNPDAQPGQYVCITVSDTGSGIPQTVRDRIFDPFFTTKEVGKGTGLGLATVQAVVKSHGGLINVYSEEGEGTEFKIYIPAFTDPEGERPGQVERRLARGHGETILVVDDEDSVREITKQTLEAFGYRVLLAEDGADALAVYMQHRDKIALVLTDMMMPVMDGFATIQALRKIEPTVKIVAASGLAADGLVAKASNAGVKHFLSKPYAADALLGVLAELLTESESAIGDSRNGS